MLDHSFFMRLKSKQLRLLFLFFLYFFASWGALWGVVDLKNIFKDSIHQPLSADPGGSVERKEGLKRTQTILESSPEKSLIYSQPVTFITRVLPVNLTEKTPSGTIRLEINRRPLFDAKTLVNGSALFTTSAIPVTRHKQHDFMAIYSGDQNYEGSKDLLQLSVFPAHTTSKFISRPVLSILKEPVAFKVKVDAAPPATATPDGSIQFFIDGSNVSTVPLDASGHASFSTSEFSVGTHIIAAIYQGNENFIPSKVETSQEVDKAYPVMQFTSSDNPSLFGQTIAFTAKITSAAGLPSGQVQFRINGIDHGKPIFLNGSGEAVSDIQNMPSGQYNVEAYYLGDHNFHSSKTAITQKINKTKTKTELTTLKNIMTYGQPVKVTAAVTSETAQPVGFIQFKVKGKNFGKPQTLFGNGQADMMIPLLNTGSHQIEAHYLGNENFDASTAALIQQVNQAPTKIDLISYENPSMYGQTVKVMATATSKKFIPLGQIQFKIDGKNEGPPQTLSESGQVLMNFKELDAGSFQIEARYLGHENFSASSTALMQQVIKAETSSELSAYENPSTYGQTVKLTAAVQAGNLTATGKVQFKADGQNEGLPQILSDSGQATITLEQLKGGLHQLEMRYLGDKNFSPSAAIINQQVNRAETSLSISSSENPSMLLHALTFTASVTAEGAPTGTVQFQIDEKNIDHPITLNKNKQATLTITSGLKFGSQKVEAIYSGDGNFNPSTSPPLIQEMTPSPSIDPNDLPEKEEAKN